jgi:hypothetical protein
MRLIGSSDIMGQLALNAVKQHPYHAPEGLFDLVQEVLALCRRDFKDGIEGWETRWFESSNAVYRWLKDALGEDHTTLKAWNTPKSGHTGNVFMSRYGGPAPHDDFIDIDALLQNVAMGAWRDSAEYEKGVAC